MFIIDLEGNIRIKASLSKQFHLAPCDIDKMPYWEYEIWLTMLNQMVKEENDKQESDLRRYKLDQAVDNMQSTTRKPMQMPKMPAMPKMPKL